MFPVSSTAHRWRPTGRALGYVPVVLLHLLLCPVVGLAAPAEAWLRLVAPRRAARGPIARRAAT